MRPTRFAPLVVFVPAALLLAGEPGLPATAGLARVPVRQSLRVPAAGDSPLLAGPRVRLQAGEFDPLSERLDFSSVQLELQADGEVGYGLVQFAPGRAAARKELEAAGVRFFGYVPDGAFQVQLTPESLRLLSAHPAVRWMGEWAPGYRVSPRLWPGAPFQPEITLVAFPGQSADDLSRRLVAEFPAVARTFVSDDPSLPRARLAVPESLRQAFLARAATLDGVAWIEPYVPMVLHNVDSSGPIQGNAPSPGGRTIFARGLTGTGQIVAVSDSGCDSDMCFFRNLNGVTAITDASNTVPPALGPLFPDRKVIGYWVQPGATAYDNDSVCSGSSNVFHGTHTSATAVGDNLLTPSTPATPGVDAGDGMAPNAQLLFQDVGNDATGCLDGLGDMAALFLQAFQGGARVHSNSWGGDTAGAYTTDDWTVDRFLSEHEEMTIFFSAGNSGRPTPPDVGTTGSPANAKNAIAVGALGHGASTSVASFSSRGPTLDGRIKPDLMAPGSSIVSAAGDSNHGSLNCSTKSLSGTSMACPTAAGAAALLREYFSTGFYPSGRKTTADALEVPAALVKAVLLNGTLPLPSAGAFGNGDYGWGRVFLDNNLYFDGDARKLRVWSLAGTEGLLTGESRTFTVTVPAGQEFRATLAWVDPEGTLGAARVLVNDLDLSVSGPSRTWLGNVLDAASGESVEGGSADRLNNVEQVRLSNPAAGTYTITVTARDVPGNGRAYTERQGFALAVSSASCGSGVAASPTGLQVVSHPVMGTNLSFTPAAGSTATQVYRAAGGCSAAAGRFQYVGTATGAAYTDARAEGGLTYGYRLRGADACGEGPVSSCVAVTPAGRCDLVPAFDGLASAVAGSPACRVHLAWAAATPSCSSAAPITYNVYRSTVPGFVPNRDTLRASVVSGTSWNDRAPGFLPGVTYHYVVRAEEAAPFGTGPNGGNEEGNLKHLFATPAGAPGSLGTFTDGGGDGTAWLEGESPWQLTSTQAQTGTYSYHNAEDGASYRADTCAALMTPALALGTGSTLSYWARYNLEFQWDGVVVEISTDGGSTWTDLPPTSPAGYPDTFFQTGSDPVNACKYISTQGAFTGPKDNSGLTSWTRYQTSLSPKYDGKTARIRWRFSSDPGTEYSGFFLDTVAITKVFVPSPCAADSRTVVPAGDGQPVVKRN
jgi:hypothetical protein